MRGETILVVDDEKLIRWSLRKELEGAGFAVIEAEGAAKCLTMLEEHDPDVMILDQILPDGTGIDILRTLRGSDRRLPVIMLTAVDKSDIAVQAMKLGASDYVTKPVNIDELKILLENVLESTRLRRQVDRYLAGQQKQCGFCGMIGTSFRMKNLFAEIRTIAQSSTSTVLITGESGSGKELVAKAIHFLGERAGKPLMTVNFSALSEYLIESELFGHEKGAFTDARAQKKGLFELAEGGTIFLDEIGDISPRIQVKLLRVLEQKSFQRVGGTAEISVDVRIIAATNRGLEQLVRDGEFRLDLYYRLNVAQIIVPPLREREGDVVALAEYFLQDFNSQFHKQSKALSNASRELLLGYHWPGNVRELKNMMERAALLGSDGIIEPGDLRLPEPLEPAQGSSSPAADDAGDTISLTELETRALVRALEKTNYNQSRAARLLKISRDTLRYRMKKYNLPGK
jgi:DNA-binding NtrC family response regulator